MFQSSWIIKQFFNISHKLFLMVKISIETCICVFMQSLSEEGSTFFHHYANRVVYLQ